MEEIIIEILGEVAEEVIGVFLDKAAEKSKNKRKRKTKDNVLAQYATSAINVPVRISEYELNNLIPDDYKSSMPTIEEILGELHRLLQEQEQ